MDSELNNPIPFKNAWATARDRYIEDLTEEEQQSFNKATLESIYCDALAAEEIHRASSTSRAFFEDKIRPLVAAIEQYGNALDIYSNSYSLVLCPLWGSVRVVLQLAREFGKYYDKLVDMFNCIGDMLPRFQTYEKLFPSHARLVEALSVIYVDILKFCRGAKAVFRRAKHSSVNIGNAIKLAWKPFDQQFGQMINDLKRHRENVEKEAGLAHMLEAANAREVELAHILELEREKKEEDRLRILKMLSALKYDEKQRKLQKIRYGDTGSWLLKNNVFTEWLNSEKSSCLCCYGMPGSGKSVLTSKVIDTILAVVDFQKISVAYYYCDYADHRTLDTVTLLGTIIMQLIRTIPISNLCREKILRAYDNGLRTPTINELIEIHDLVIQSYSQIFIIIDGLDECDKHVRHDVLSYINRIATSNFPVVRALLSSREEDQILHSLKIHSQVRLTASVLAPDIESFVAGSVSSLIESKDLRITNPALKNEIVTELVSKADGMILWVHFQLTDLCEASSDNIIRETLRHLPYGLIETYARILKKIYDRKLRINLVQKVFKWAACATRPLQLEEMREAVAFEPESKFWDIGAIPYPTEIIGSCGGLVILDDDETVRFAHHTVRQFLQSEPEFDVMEGFHFTMTEADSLAGQICVAYLSFTDFETQVIKPIPEVKVGPSDVLGTDIVDEMPRALGIGKYLFSVPYRLLGGKCKDKSVDVDMAKFSKFHIKKPPTSFMMEKYRLLEYVVQSWGQHTRSWIHDGRRIVNDDTWMLFKDLALHKNLSFDFRPWGVNQHSGPEGCRLCSAKDSVMDQKRLNYVTLFDWAIQNGHAPLLKLLHERNKLPGEFVGHGTLIDYCHHDSAGNDRLHSGGSLSKSGEFLKHKSALSSACGNGYYEVAKMLMELCYGRVISETHPLSVETQYHYSRTQHYYSGTQPLFEAAENGHEKLLKMLLGYCSEEILSNMGASVLLRSVKNGHEGVIQALLEHKIDIRASDKDGNTALHIASQEGHEAIVTILLRRGASPTWYNESEHTALHIAVDKGHEKILHLLLESTKLFMSKSNPDPKVMQDFLCLILHHAIEGGHQAMTQTILQHGAKPDWLNFDGLCAINVAAKYGQEGIMRLLFRHVTHINGRDRSGGTALHMAASYGHVEVIRLLVNTGGNLNEQDNAGESALHRAVLNNHLEVVHILLEAGSDTDTSSFSALFLAAGHNPDPLIAELLLRYGADIRAKDIENRTVTYIALDRGDPSIPMIEFFLDKEFGILRSNPDTAPIFRALDKRDWGKVMELLNQHRFRIFPSLRQRRATLADRRFIRAE